MKHSLLLQINVVEIQNLAYVIPGNLFSMNHIMHLNPQPFDDIKSGKKTIEARINDEKRQLLNTGDFVTFINRMNHQTISVQILKISTYKSFEEMFNELGITNFGYSINTTITKATESMNNYYSEKETKKYGVIGIHLQLNDSDKMPA